MSVLLPSIYMQVTMHVFTGVLQLEVTRQQHASAPVRGHYTISFNSSTTVPLPHDASPLEVSRCQQLKFMALATIFYLQIKTALEALDGLNEVTVYTPQPLPQDSLGKFCPGRVYQVQFEVNSGDLPLLQIGSGNLLGEELNTRVEEVRYEVAANCYGQVVCYTVNLDP